jgi:hypothetical protein
MPSFWFALMLLIIPISAIVSMTYLKSKKLNEDKDKDKDKISRKELLKLLDVIETINEENRILRKRVENLETIVANENWIEKLALPENTSQKEIEKLAKLLKKKD